MFFNIHRLILLFFLVCVSFFSFAVKINYPVSEIPEELTKNAKAVIRFEEYDYDMTSISNGTAKCRLVITVLNESGFDNAIFNETYDKYIKIKSLSATIYDDEGKKVKSVSSDDFGDYSAVSGYSLYEDNRIKYYRPEYRIYPFTIEYDYHLDFDRGLFQFPSWAPVHDYNISLQKSVLRVSAPNEMGLRYKSFNLNIEPDIKKDNTNTIFEWDLENYSVIREEPFSPSYREVFPIIYLAPSRFKFNGTEGSMDEWEYYGAWIKTLLEEKNNLSEEAAAELRELVKDCTTKHKKIERIYSYLQNKMRYVSIQIGIGGWEPFDAETVHEESYGDCKALTNYLMTALEVVGIKSYYTLVKAGDNSPGVMNDFPSNQFNHVFLCVPEDNDTLWVECTDFKQPLGFMGSFTDNRNVLILDNKGGSMVCTPKYTARENHKLRHSKLILDEYGDVKASIKTKFIGVASEEGYYLQGLDNKDLEDYIYKRSGLKDFTIDRIIFSEKRQQIPVITEDLDITVENYTASVSGDFIIPLYPFSDFEIPRRIRNRKNKVYIRREFMETDSITFQLPESITVKDLPAEVQLKTKFGEYQITFLQTNNNVCVTRSVKINSGEYPPSDYRYFREFLEDIVEADKSKCLLGVK